MSARHGSLFSGYGGLDLAVESVFGAETVWHVENDPHAAKVLAHHWPDVPNLVDVTVVDWTQVEPVDVLSGGFPCQDISSAGKGAGIKEGTRSGLWYRYADAVRVLRPRLVVVENVSALLVRGLDIVAGSLAEIGYDFTWTCLRASDIGACHRRERLFLLAWPAADAHDLRCEGSEPGSRRHHCGGDPRPAGDLTLLPTPMASLGRGTGTPSQATAHRRQHEEGRRNLDDAVALLPTPKATDTTGAHAVATNGRTIYDHGPDLKDITNLLPTPSAANPNDGEDLDGWQARRDRVKETSDNGNGFGVPLSIAVRLALAGGSAQWGRYAAAIARHEVALGRAAPSPTDERGRLSARFCEWMMGLPDGWVTDLLGRGQALKRLGNGVLPLQAETAIRLLSERAALEVAS